MSLPWKLVLLSLAMFYNVGEGQDPCLESSCGEKGPSIQFPFSLADSDNRCSYPGFALSCNGKHTVLQLQKSVNLFVKRIDYKSQVMEVSDPGNCLPKHFLSVNIVSGSSFHFVEQSSSNYTLFNCSKEQDGQTLPYSAVPCLSGASFYVYFTGSFSVIGNVPRNCKRMSHTQPLPYGMTYFNDYYQIENVNNIRLGWSEPRSCGRCEANGKMCRRNNNSTRVETECFDPPRQGQSTKFVAVGATVGGTILVALLVVAFRVYSYDNQQRENRVRIERFLEDYRAQKPSRYSYADIKLITSNFKEKLGEGAFGTVFKGKLADDFFVAAKLLNFSKGEGEEFINEVGTIGQIHHVNVVRLVGFCADGFHRALVYEFLPNGSLQGFISSPDDLRFLGWRSLQEISLGIAKGIEYLHQGCDQRILHFDIKPHNVLLDRDFTPKISDFGLAKLYARDRSAVSITAARGTMGYIAPEVFSRNFGNVSYKSDVYSFGMMLLEMVSGRKTSSDGEGEALYPEWIHNLLEYAGEDVRIVANDGGEEGDLKTARRLATVGLWCIQWQPADRPSMETVVHMLEGKEPLSTPPNPFVAATLRKRPHDRKHKARASPDLEAITELE